MRDGVIVEQMTTRWHDPALTKAPLPAAVGSHYSQATKFILDRVSFARAVVGDGGVDAASASEAAVIHSPEKEEDPLGPTMLWVAVLTRQALQAEHTLHDPDNKPSC